jgi:RNA polymerase sigma factor (sigma-70 family)
LKATLEKLKRIELRDDLATRKSLISRLRKADDQDGWSVFFEVYWRLIYSAARKSGLSNAECEDVVQDTVISVCNAMPTFHYNREQGHFRNWLFQLTSWRIKDQFRRRGSEELLPIEDVAVVEEQEPAIPAELEERWNEEWEANLLYVAVEKVRQRFDPKQFQLFELSVLKEWPTERIQSFLKVGKTRIYVARHRVFKLIKAEIAKLKKQCS